MPHSYVGLYYHCVFGTKYRAPLITRDFEQQLYDYIGGIVRSNGGTLIAAGGIEDHIHLLLMLRTQRSLADVMRRIKADSSRWVHRTFPDKRTFAWQTGYGAFTVSASIVARVKRYIANQRRHHAATTFKDEFLRFLREYNVPYDERYVWE